MDDFLLLGLAALIAFFLGPIGFFMALGLRGRVAAIEGLTARVATLEAELARARSAPTGESAAAAAPEPPPLFAEPPAEAPATDTQPPIAAAAETEAAAPPPLPEPPASAPTTPPPLPQQARPIGLEEKLGAHWAVIVGGIALALGALLLVKYSIESGFFGPVARVIAGLLLGLGLVAAGEVLRRKERASAAGVPIPAVLTGAGTVAAFGSLYAAHALYGFIGPGSAFIVMGAVGVATMLAAALHGPGLAGLGLIGALGAPLLVSSSEPNPWPVVLFVAIVCAAAYALARLRRWLWLAIAAAIGAALWQGLFLIELDRVDFAGASLVHLVVETALVLAAFAWIPLRETPPAQQSPDPVAASATLAAAATAAIVLAGVALQGFYGPAWIAAAALVVALPGLTGARLPAVAAASAGAGLLVLVVLAFWGAKGEPMAASSPVDWLTIWPRPKDLRLFETFGVVASAALGALATRRLLDPAPVSPLSATIYAASGVLTPLAALSIAYLRSANFQSDARLAATAGVLAFALTAIATLFRQRADAETRPALVLGLGASAAGAFAALALGLVFLLSQGTLTVALALAALAAAFVGERLAIRALRWAAMGLAVAVAGRLAYDPRILGDDLGRTIIFNWLLFGYGVPALAFGLAARLMRRSGDDPPLRVVQALAILCSALLVVFEIRHAMNNGDPFAPSTGLAEQGLMTLVGILFSLVLMELGALRDDWLYRTASLCFSVIVLGQTVGLLLWLNPYFSGERIEGGALFNGLILGYLLPAFAAFAFARRARQRPPQWRRQAAAAAAIALVFAYVNLELRRLFQGRSAIGFHIHASQGEFYAYSALWLGLGILLLAYGVLARSKPARLASAVLVAATVFKVFVFDLAGLEGVLRALSFLGLGAALIGIGLVYQRLLFPRMANAPGAPGAPPGAM